MVGAMEPQSEQFVVDAADMQCLITPTLSSVKVFFKSKLLDYVTLIHNQYFTLNYNDLFLILDYSCITKAERINSFNKGEGSLASGSVSIDFPDK